MAYTSVHLPVGYKVEIETTAGGGTYTDLGVTMNDGTLNFTYDAIKVTGSRAEGILNYVKNMSIEAQFTLVQQELSNINRLMSGATAYTTVDGSAVTGATQAVTATNWGYNDLIELEHQMGDGSAPTVTAVSGSTDGPLVAGTDYFVGEANGKYGITVVDSGTVTTENQTINITYNYTPAASRVLTAGSPSVDITARKMKISKQLDTGKWWTMTIHAATNTSGLNFSLPRYDADEPSILEVTMTGQLDTTLTDMAQLFTLTDEFGVTDI